MSKSIDEIVEEIVETCVERGQLNEAFLARYLTAYRQDLIDVINKTSDWQGEIDSDYAQGCVDTKRDILEALNSSNI